MSKKEALIETAQALLWEVGYEAMSPALVMRASGAGQGSLYHHFDGKEGLAAAALARTAAEMTAEIEALMTADASAIDRLLGYVREERKALKGCRLGRLANERGVLASEALRRPVAAYFDAARNQIAVCVRAAQADGDLPAGVSAEAVADALVAAVQGGFVLARVAEEPDRMRSTLDGFLALVDAAAASARSG